MLAEECQDYCLALARRGVILSYSGYVSEGLLEALGDTVNRKMELDDTDTTTASRVFGVFVEQVQNVLRYSAEREGEPGAARDLLSNGTITIGRDGAKFFVACGNVVLGEDVAELRRRLEQLQGLDKTALKALYKKKLHEEPEAGSKGAGIGLIEIARKASEPLTFDFLATEQGHSFFFLKAYI